jgi:uncharacterized protein (TIGR02117 family)
MISIKLSALKPLQLTLGMLIALGHLLATMVVLPAQPFAQTIPKSKQTHREIFVASNGWHSAIFVARAAIPRGAIPVAPDFPRVLFLGFGWGDAAYFPKRDPGFLTLVSAALQPTPSVLHVTGLSVHPRDAYREDEVIGVKLTASGFRDLLGFLNGAFVQKIRARPTPVSPGLHPFSKFYRAKGEFHLFNNCNSWTARGLAAAGLPIEADTIFRAEGLMSVVRKLAQ